MVTNDSRMSVEHSGHNWNLRLNEVEENDSGIYMCQINKDPVLSSIGYLDVVRGGKDHPKTP